MITHHHHDHMGGVKALVKHYSPNVFSPPGSSPCITTKVQEGDNVTIDATGTPFSVITIPGHTLDHIAYFCQSDKPPILFCGDTLFAGGCGRLFEGSPKQMWSSLQKLMALPAETMVYCAHEYTLANLEFAYQMAPEWEMISQRLHDVSNLRRQKKITLPTTIGLEIRTNPFLLCTDTKFRLHCFNNKIEQQDALAAFTAMRKAKDSF